jgi:hypothetical protein
MLVVRLNPNLLTRYKVLRIGSILQTAWMFINLYFFDLTFGRIGEDDRFSNITEDEVMDIYVNVINAILSVLVQTFTIRSAIAT